MDGRWTVNWMAGWIGVMWRLKPKITREVKYLVLVTDKTSTHSYIKHLITK